MPFTHKNIKADLEDIGSLFNGAPDLEFRAATKVLELDQSSLSYQCVPPRYRFPYGHRISAVTCATFMAIGGFPRKWSCSGRAASHL